MAQRTIHYLFGELISKQVRLNDKKRFLLGSIIPDAYVDVKFRDETHFKVRGEEGTYLDFHKFLNGYFEQIQQDDLYLGYYMHLVEDAFYRKFFYNEHSKMPKSMEDVKRLHMDYHILNKYIVDKYNLKNELVQMENCYKNEFVQIGEFRVLGFLEEFEQDFWEEISGETFYITEAMVDEFVERYLPLVLKELESVRNGKSSLDVKQYTWIKNGEMCERIKEMETTFDAVQEMLKMDQLSAWQREELKEKILCLRQYQESGQWIKDFENDERGELPLDLKRGVLSEDGLYNLLSEVDIRF